MISNIVLALLTTVTGALPPGIDESDSVQLDNDVYFLGAIAPEYAQIGKSFELELIYKMPAVQPKDVWTFLHLESFDSKCRIVEDRAPSYGQPPLADGYLHHKVTVTIPKNEDCQPTTLEIFTGLWDKKTTKRYAVLNPPVQDDRLHAGWVEIVDRPITDEGAEPVTHAPSDMTGRAFWAHWRPWYPYLAGLALTALMTFLFARQLRKRPRAIVYGGEPSRFPPWVRWAFITLVLGGPMFLALLVGRDHIKDDAYISFRYARNLVDGYGLVFNVGDKLEGYTNFLWTLMMTPFEALGWDLIQVCEVLGTALICGVLVYLTRISGLLMAADSGSEPIKMGAWLWTGLWLATSTSVAHWTTSGMEQALAMFLPVLAAWLLWKAPLEDNRKGALWSGIFMGLGCMTRPEIHMIGLFMGMPLVIRTIRRLIKKQGVDRAVLYWFAGLFLITVPCHIFRYSYYGHMLPNTFYVKTGDSTLVMVEGLKKLREMFSDNAVGLLFVLTPFAFIRKERLAEKLVALAIALGFMFYLVKVGVDEMAWHRLYLPGLPFLVLLAGVGLANVCRVLASWIPMSGARVLVYGLAWIGVITWASLDFARTYSVLGGFNGRGDLSGFAHPDMGKFVTRHDHAGALVAFQDMGSTPYYAPDIQFLDFIGLVDGVVAQARYSYGLHAFLATESAKNQPQYDSDMRDYFYQRNPEWVILVSYIQGDANQEATAQRFAKNPLPESLGEPLKNNGYQFGIYNDKFEKSYTHVRTWARSRGYYLSMYRRTDLWNQTPGEVVLDQLPAGIGGVKATFDTKPARDPKTSNEQPLELMGSDIQAIAKPRQDAWLTTWFTLPGPLAPDTWIFFHLEQVNPPPPRWDVELTGPKIGNVATWQMVAKDRTFRAPFDTIPGDFMWPADRWKPGQILEHRVLFQVPFDMPVGEYRVMMGVYRHQSGERLPITQGPDDGQARVEIGRITIEPLNTPFESIIPPTNPATDRKYPDRIIDNHRPPPTGQ